MNNYEIFLDKKKNTILKSGFDICDNDLNVNLFDFQKYIVKKAINSGRYAIFADTGLGKTLMQLVWADIIVKYTKMPVIILAPLAVTEQTITEGNKFGIKVWRFINSEYILNNDTFNHFKERIYITNYEQIDHIDESLFSGVVLDESSILKSFDGKTSNKIIDKFKNTNYKLCCSATPSPNDHTELGMHSEFLNAMNYQEMLSMYFVHDGGETSKWRLRKHAEKDFWDFVLNWSIAIDNPETFGFEGSKYRLPGLNYIEHHVEVESEGLNLFGEAIVSATDLHRDLRKTIDKRINKAIELRKDIDGPVIIWGLQNKETDLISKGIKGSVNVQGSDKPEYKASKLLGFAKNEFDTLITKTKIASFGMNYQNCHDMIFLSYDFSFESFYQAVRRSYRFGQTKEVNVHIIIPKTQVNVRRSIIEKEKKHKTLVSKLSKMSFDHEKKEKQLKNSIEFSLPIWI